MIALISDVDKIRRQYVCNSADITETAGETYTTAVISDASGSAFKEKHGAKMTCIETEEDYLFDEVGGVWVRKNNA